VETAWHDRQGGLRESQEVLNRLQDPRSGEPGAAVTVEVIRYQGKAFPDLLQTAKDDMKQSNFELSPDQP